MSSNHMCPSCHHTSLRRPPAWGIAVVALAWAFVATMLFVSALIGPFIMFAVPVIFAFGAGRSAAPTTSRSRRPTAGPAASWCWQIRRARRRLPSASSPRCSPARRERGRGRSGQPLDPGLER
ncbi:hypothetical protein [Nannocystis pusilla]|uniref:hypothetical protein n=1 Tax=Nannocystis pusilla TaxID=889268 RepID=UPI003B7933E9